MDCRSVYQVLMNTDEKCDPDFETMLSTPCNQLDEFGEPVDESECGCAIEQYLRPMQYGKRWYLGVPWPDGRKGCRATAYLTYDEVLAARDRVVTSRRKFEEAAKETARRIAAYKIAHQ